MSETFRCPEDLRAWLEEQAKASSLTKTEILIEILKNAKEGKPLKTPSEGNKYQLLDQECKFLKWLEADAQEKEGFYCIRTDGAKRRLSEAMENTTKICEACNARKTIKEVLTALQQGGSGTYYTCKMGGQISEFDTDQVECPIDPMHKWTKFTEYCKNNNPETKAQEPCPYLQPHQIQLKQVNRESTSKKERR